MVHRAIIVLGLILAAAGLHAEKTMAFQTGVSPLNDYGKCTDTFIASLYQQVPFGENRHVAIAGQGSPSYGLLRFDLADYIPLSATVKQATLKMYPKLYTGIERDMRWYVIAAKWKENECTWEVASSGVTWSGPGGDVYVTQRSGSLDAGKEVHTWDLTDIVQAWVKFPDRNH